MKTFPLARIITLPNRQRRAFDEAKMHEFADGIEKRGLLHPIVCRWAELVPGEPQNLILVAGERRFRAISDLAALGTQIKHDGQEVPPGHIPYTMLEELDPLAYEEAELEENIHRVDLTWQERAAAHARLADLRTGQAKAAGKPLPTIADIAIEVRGSAAGDFQDLTRKEIILAKHLDNPAIKGATTAKEAFKILKKQEQTERHRVLGASVGATFNAGMHKALNENSLDYLKALPNEAFDCILTDPPYGMGADEFGDSGGLAAGAHGYADTWEHAELCYLTLATEGYRVAKAQAHLYAFCDVGRFELISAILFAAGWQVFRTPLIWYKKTGSRAPWPELGPQRKYETIVYAIKGKRPTLKMAGDVLDFSPDDNLGHAAQKPVALYRELLSRTCLPGNAVLDPFCGTGPVFPAAHDLHIRATGIEVDTASYGIAVKRIEDLSAQASIDSLLSKEA